MNHELYIARRMSLNGEQQNGSPSLTVALVGIVLAVTVMILSVAVVMGFKGEITGKIMNLAYEYGRPDLFGIGVYKCDILQRCFETFGINRIGHHTWHVGRYKRHEGVADHVGIRDYPVDSAFKLALERAPRNVLAHEMHVPFGAVLYCSRPT